MDPAPLSPKYFALHTCKHAYGVKLRKDRARCRASVQRVALRCKVLKASRKAQLDGIGFDKTGPDPLS